MSRKVTSYVLMRSGVAGNDSPARAASSVGTISHHDAPETFTDGAESKPLPSVGENFFGSVNSISAADSADGPAAEIVVSSSQAAGPDSATGEVRPSDDEIIAQENSIRYACCLLA